MSMLRRLWNVVRRPRIDDDLREELATHLALIEEEERRAGLPPEEARRRARTRFGSPLAYREQALDAVVTRWAEDAWKDVRFAVRQLRKAPAFTAVAAVSLAVGIGANTAIFTLVNAVLLKSLPVRNPGGLVLLGDASGSGVGVGQAGSYVLYSNRLYEHLRAAPLFDSLCAVQSGGNRIGVLRAGSAGSETAAARFVSGNYFDVLGVAAAAGRTIVAADDDAAALPVAVISDRYWSTALNRDPGAIGMAIDLNGVAVTIVGVAPSGFYGETIEPDPPSFWLPIAASRHLDPASNLIDEADLHWLYLLGRLKPGVTTAQAEAGLTGLLQNWLIDRRGAGISAERRAAIAHNRVELTPAGGGVPHMQRDYAQTLRILLGLSIAVLLIACANIAGLLVARGMARATERSVRLALGATRGRLVRQSLVESLTLAVAGGGLALLVAPAVARLLVAMVFRGADYVPIETTPDARVLAFTSILSIGAAIVFGLLPALRPPAEIASAMKNSRFPLSKALVIGEVAVSLAVLAGAGALVRTLANLEGQNFGFERTHVLVAGVDPALAGYGYDRLGPLYRQLEARLNALPGVKSAAFSYYSPFNGCCWAFTVTVPGYVPQPNERRSAVLNRVSPRYFETIGTTVLRGRAFSESDTPDSRRVIVVNDRFVQRFLANMDPLGRNVHINSEGLDVDLEIVGVVENAKYEDPREELRPMIFLPLLQMKPGDAATSSDFRSNFINAIEVRTTGEPAGTAALVRRTIADIDPAIPVRRVETMSEQVRATLGRDRVVAALAATFGGLALTLTGVGLYGLMAYLVQRRTRDIGIRIALGAARRDVIGMVMREAVGQAAIGILAGVPAAFVATRLIASQLYGVSALDPRSAIAASVALIACLGAAAWLPARRASRIDPIRVLHQE